jgi:hypothetical protein
MIYYNLKIQYELHSQQQHMPDDRHITPTGPLLLLLLMLLQILLLVLLLLLLLLVPPWGTP